MGGKVKELRGSVFGRLTVLQFSHMSKHRSAMWDCLCECGNQVTVDRSSLISGLTKSCGCLSRERAAEANTVHGLYYHPMYQVWANMQKRIFNKNCPIYSYYGGRGITICDRWLDLENFIADMYPSFKEGLEINRVNPNGNYCPENCVWATESEQGHFQRKRKGCSSKYVGVNIRANNGVIRATITVNGEQEHLGCFIDELSAATAYDNASEKIYGDRPNGTVRQIKGEE